MKEIRLFHRRFNLTSNQNCRAPCVKSLAHSLRIVTDENSTKKLEWSEELQHLNVIWRNGETRPLHAFSDEEKMQVLHQIAPKPSIFNHNKWTQRHRNYRLKIRKAIDSERKAGNEVVAIFLEAILQKKDFVSCRVIKEFEDLTMKRKNQRVKMLSIYRDAHNRLTERPNKNLTFIQEGIFKVPSQWQVSNELISLHEYVLFTEKFLTHHFPQYPIKAILGHDDERGEDEKTGAHTHYYLSGQNSKTGKFDLLQTQRAVVNDYIVKQGLWKKQLPIKGNMSKEKNTFFGEMFQKMLFEYANEHLFKVKGLVAVLAPETERRSEQRKKMNREAKLPKSQREFNFHNRKLEKQAEKINALKKETENVKEKLKFANDQFDDTIDRFFALEKDNKELKNNKQILREQVINLRTEEQTLQGIIRSLHDDVIGHLKNFCINLFIALHSRDLGIQKKVKEYINKALSHLLKLPAPLKERASEMIEAIELTDKKQRQNTMDNER